METFYQIGRATIVFSLIIQLIILALQAAALARHGHRSFLLLSLSTALTFIYAVLTGIPYFVTIPEADALNTLKIATLFGVAGAVLAVWGTASLFNSYRKLAAAVSRDRTGNA